MFNIVDNFEQTISKFFGSPYGVAVDCCTHAIELCLRYAKVNHVTCPNKTYVSIPFTLTKLGIDWNFENNLWENYYYIGNTNIIDAAVVWKENSYISGTFMCLSFQYKKHLNLGRGGMILTDDVNAYQTLKKMSYDGRLPDIPWGEQDIESIGYHYYMTPETASQGLEKFNVVKDLPPQTWSFKDYPNLENMKVFKK